MDSPTPPLSVSSLGSDSESLNLPQRTDGPDPIDISQHGTYYFDDGDLYITVDNILFRIHSYFILKHAPSLFDAVPRGTGLAKTSPIVIDNVSAEDFSQVLWVFYDHTFERIASADKWVIILLAAEKLHMQRVVDLAVRKLKDLPSPVQTDHITQITVHDHHFIRKGWATQAYFALCTRPEPLTRDEAERLGFELVVLIARAREEVYKESASDDLDLAGEIVANVIASYTQQLLEVASQPLDDTIRYDVDVVGASLVIEVDGVDFMVHHYFLALHAPLLHNLLSPDEDQAWDDVHDGTKPACLVQLDGTSAQHFSWLVWMFYDETFALAASPEQWKVIRNLAERYSMKYIGAYATKQLRDSLDLVEQVLSIERFEMPGEWANDAFAKFYRRSASLTVEEGERLGPKLWAKVSEGRERHLQEELSRWEECGCCQFSAVSEMRNSKGKKGGKKKKVWNSPYPLF